MIAWKGLIKKEWKLQRPNLFIAMVVLIVIPLIGYTVSRYFGEVTLFPTLMIGFIFAHIFILPILFLDALNKEGKTQLWLYNPNRVMKLVLAKFICSFTIFFISVSITSLITYVVSRKTPTMWKTNVSEEALVAFSSMSIVSFLIITIFLSLWVLFLWAVYHTLGRILWLKKIRWFLIFILLLAVNMFNNWIQRVALYQKLLQLWVIKWKGFYFEVTEHSFSFRIGSMEAAEATGMLEISVISLLLQLGIATFLFFFSLWLFEEKVEVEG